MEMETDPLVINQEDELEPEAILGPRNRRDVYTADELIMSILTWSRPIMDVLTWQLPIVTSSWLILGLIVIYFLANFSLPSLLGLMGLAVMGVVMLYAAIQRVEPYQELGHHPMLAGVRVPLEVVDPLAEMLTNWLDRWVATAQYLVFSHDIRPCVIVSVTSFYLVICCVYFGGTTVLMMAYCLAFILPMHWSHEWRQLYQRPWQGLVRQLDEELPEEEEEINSD